MMIHIGLIALALAAAAPCAAQGDTTTAEEQAQFDLLKKRHIVYDDAVVKSSNPRDFELLAARVLQTGQGVVR